MTVEHLECGAKLARLETSERVEFSPISHYHPLMSDGTTAVRTGIQTAEPGYVAEMHQHPYEELLFILEGEADVWVEGHEDAKRRMKAGDMASMPPNTPHTFAVAGDKTMRMLGIHHSKERIVEYVAQDTNAEGYPLQGTDK